MEKSINILVLLVFINFLALPSMARIFDIDIPQTNIVLSEEEASAKFFFISEKNIPKTFSIRDFLSLFEEVVENRSFALLDDGNSPSPYYSAIYPPPEHLFFS